MSLKNEQALWWILGMILVLRLSGLGFVRKVWLSIVVGAGLPRDLPQRGSKARIHGVFDIGHRSASHSIAGQARSHKTFRTEPRCLPPDGYIGGPLRGNGAQDGRAE